MEKLLFTIAIPAYNNEKSIKKTIDSCIAQKTNINYEILILDDASTDTTPQIVKSYNDSKIRIVTLEERVPLIANHNKCLEHALGEYIMFCHADDVLESHAIAQYAKKLEERDYPNKYVLWGHSMFRDFSHKAMNLEGFSYSTIMVGEYTPKMFFYGGLTPSGTLYSRQSFLDFGGYIETAMNASPSDMTTMIHLALNGFRFEMIDEMIFYREGSSTALLSDDINIYLNEIDDAFQFFIKQSSDQVLKKLITLATPLKNKPIYFLYAMAQSDICKPQINRIMIKHIIKSPFAIKDPIVRKVLKRVI